MTDGYIAVLDSGIGGLFVLKELIRTMPNERYLYFGDSLNAPYGNKSLSQLKEITERNVDRVKSYGIKMLVLGCNTLSTNLRREISDYSGVPTFCVYPPIEYALTLGGKVLLLATLRTAEKYRGLKGLDVVGLKNLAYDVEYNMYNARAIDVEINLSQYASGSFMNLKGYYNTVILGCTHYNFVKNEILDHFQPQNIISGEKFTAKQISKYLQSDKSLVNNKRFELKFLSDCEKIYQKISVNGGQSDLKF